ncbi:molybdate ABC transporter substrate-binding protein [Virgibacillus indicus]|uniref:Molybdate ABC transporter substrate-binding protein n=1 Tax=Virgibacillus indicus TaxID=2024554 RepID=A0A265N5Y1_9BACI|nr:molybdate ABC transporter substrate-binding protein [Virgibacillus indicus]OZU87433.1 molybdate ABC transporter substrate-binding protein [Virgibacillus indicus]
MRGNFKLAIMLIFTITLTMGCSDRSDTHQAADESSENVELTISAAASLKDAMDEIQNNYVKEHSEVALRINFGGSGSLKQQIYQGAPVDLFLSAAEDKFAELVDEGMIEGKDSADLLGNELVLIVPSESDITNFQDLETTEVNTISIGTPETVPAGEYARESLENIGIWENVKPKTVYAKDVRQVLSYVETGNVDAGIVYKTDALISDKVKIAATADPNTYTSITYPIGIIKDSEHYEAASDFYSYLQSDAARQVFEEYGFTVN